MSDEILLEVRTHTLVIRLNRPAARNAIDASMTRALEEAVDRLENDDELWVGVLTATIADGRPVFCAGADLKTVDRGETDSLYTERGGFAGFVYRERVKPIVAAVDGLATGGGLELLLACDIIVASTRASFGLAEVRRNLLPTGGGLHRLPSAIGRGPALEVILTGQPMSAEAAHQRGLVARLVKDGDSLDSALAIADSIVEAAPLAVRAARRAVVGAATADDVSMRRIIDAEAARLRDTADAAEGTAAFIEKRTPMWAGR